MTDIIVHSADMVSEPPQAIGALLWHPAVLALSDKLMTELPEFVELLAGAAACS